MFAIDRSNKTSTTIGVARSCLLIFPERQKVTRRWIIMFHELLCKNIQLGVTVFEEWIQIDVLTQYCPLTFRGLSLDLSVDTFI